MKPVPVSQNWMEQRRVTFNRDNGLLVSQKKDLETSSEVHPALFEAEVPHCINIQDVTNCMRGYMTTITTLVVAAKMIMVYREIVVRAAMKVDLRIVDIERNNHCE